MRYLVVWDAVTLPREEGGLGIKEALAWNKALFFKLVRIDLVFGLDRWLAGGVVSEPLSKNYSYNKAPKVKN